MKPAAAAACCLAGLLAGCPAEPPEPDPPAAPPPPPERPALARCENEPGGYAVSYPAEWRTNPGTVMPECSLFDPEPIEVPVATDLPLDIAIAIRVEPVEYEQVVAPELQDRVLSRSEAEVASRRAERQELEGTGELFLPAGVRTYRYVVDWDDRTLVAATYDVGRLDYGSKRDVLDSMMTTLERR